MTMPASCALAVGCPAPLLFLTQDQGLCDPHLPFDWKWSHADGRLLPCAVAGYPGPKSRAVWCGSERWLTTLSYLG